MFCGGKRGEPFLLLVVLVVVVVVCGVGGLASRIDFAPPSEQSSIDHLPNLPQRTGDLSNGASLLKTSKDFQTAHPKAQLSEEEYNAMLAFDPEDTYYLARKQQLAAEAAKLRKPVPLAAPYNVTYDGRSLFIDGQRRLLKQGMWPDLLARTKAAGVDVVQTYVFWNVHEPVKGGPLNFADNADLLTFLELCQQNGLYVNLRIGPYICAEWNFGGFPFWLKQEEGIVFRDNSKPFMNEMAAWMTTITEIVKPMFASQGGPIILAQVENEYGWLESTYGLNGTIYANWSIAFANNLDIGIPWIMCRQDNEPAAINTCNGYYCDSWLQGHWQTFPNQPAFWTENWGGWFQHWGEPVPKRLSEEIAYAIIRWYAQGGSLMNYYMWHGGTNFGRWVGGPFIVTSYDYDVMLNEYGLPNEPKYSHLTRLHDILHTYEQAIIDQPPANGMDTSGDGNVLSFVYNNATSWVAFIINFSETDYTVVYSSTSYYVGAWSAIIVANDQLIYNTSDAFDTVSSFNQEILPISADKEKRENAPPSVPTLSFWTEPFAGSNTPSITNPTPLEQLNLTQDLTDYLWYSTNVTFPPSCSTGCMLFLNNTGDATHVFVDQVYLGYRIGHGTPQNFSLLVESGPHSLQILTSGMGLVNNGVHMERWTLGLVGEVFIGNSDDWLDITTNGWEMKVGLLGEDLQIFNTTGNVNWNPDWKQGINQPLTWFYYSFDVPSSMSSSSLLAIDFNGMTKGIAYLNGRGLGRYHSAIGTEPGCTGCSWTLDYTASDCRVNCGLPSQRFYHVPSDWLQPTDNSLVFFEEVGGNPLAVQLVDLSAPSSICEFVEENNWLALSCPLGSVVTSVENAFFGTPTAALCGLNRAGSCNSNNSVSIVSELCINRSYCYVQASIDVFGDPCPGQHKSLSVELGCSSPYQ